MSTQGYKILSIDAWNGPEGWFWNAWYGIGHELPREMIDATPRKILRWFREEGIASKGSAGKLAVEDDGYNVVIVARGTREPLWAIACGDAET